MLLAAARLARCAVQAPGTLRLCVRQPAAALSYSSFPPRRKKAHKPHQPWRRRPRGIHEQATAFETETDWGEKARQLFGFLPNTDVARTGYKKLRKRLAMPKLVDYNFNYYRPSAEFVMRRSVKGWLTEKQEVQATKLERLKAKGKGPPKKGQGKRTKKKKR